MAVTLRSGVVATFGEFGDFEEVAGGNDTSQVTDYFPAGALSPQKLLGSQSTGDITLTRAFDPTRDQPLIDYVKRFKAGQDSPRAVTKVYKNQQGVIQASETYPVCKVHTVNKPEGKSGDGAPSMISIVMAVENSL